MLCCVSSGDPPYCAHPHYAPIKPPFQLGGSPTTADSPHLGYSTTRGEGPAVWGEGSAVSGAGEGVIARSPPLLTRSPPLPASLPPPPPPSISHPQFTVAYNRCPPNPFKCQSFPLLQAQMNYFVHRIGPKFIGSRIYVLMAFTAECSPAKGQ